MKKWLVAMMAGMIILTGCKMEMTWDKQSSITLPSDKILISGAFNENMAEAFLKATTEVKDYHLIINSPGGNAYDLLAMMNRVAHLQAQGAHITTEVYGYAFSAGAFLFLTGDTRIAHGGSVLMLHCAGLNSFGGRTTVKSDNSARPYIGDILSLLDRNFEKMLIEKTTMTLEEVHHWLYFEDANFMGATEALEWNIATEVKGT